MTRFHIPPITNSGLDLRDYQHKLKQDTFQAWRDGAQDVCLVSGTGTGKTRTSMSIVHEFSNAGIPSVVAAHRQELVGQLSCALAAENVYHNIIAAKPTIRWISNKHIELYGRSYYHPEATAIVSSSGTLVKRDMSYIADRIGLFVTDECFPSWVQVDGRPISVIKVGDTVTAFNEDTGQVEPRKVVRLFKNPAPLHMVRFVTKTHHVIHCTSGHPIFTKRGWVNAIDLTIDDEVLIDGQMYRGAMLHVRGSGQVDQGGRKAREGVLQQGMLDQVSGEDFVGDRGEDEQEVCVGTHDATEPDAPRGGAREGFTNPEGDRARPEAQGRQRETGHRGGDQAARDVFGAWIQAADDREDERKWVGASVPGSLQSGLRECEIEDRDRSGRAESREPSQERAGRTEGDRLVYVGLGSVQVYERGDLARLAEGVCDGHVYNIEVEGLHTYIANGVVVHNCHHLLKTNTWGKCRNKFPQALGLGVTATPERSDGLGLGRHADGFFDSMVEGPSMREQIRRGFICDYRVFMPPSDFDYSSVDLTASGDYSPSQLAAASRKSHIVGDVVEHYLRIAPGKRGMTFAVSVEDAHDMAAAYNAAGVPAVAISGEDSSEVRTDALRRFERGELLQIVNVSLFGEGTDCPAIEVISMARPTNSYSLYIQIFGRALRPSPGKTHALIIDHVGNVERFIAKGRGLPDTPQKWSLDRRERGAKSVKPDDVLQLTTCLADGCFAAYDSALPACPWCGAEPQVAAGGRSAPERVDGELYEMPLELMAQLRGEADRIVEPDYPEQVRQEVLAKRGPYVSGIMAEKRARMLQDAQLKLRGYMAQWLNIWERLGLPLADVQRMFAQTFGCDVLNAQTLGLKETQELGEQVRIALDGLK